MDFLRLNADGRSEVGYTKDELTLINRVVNIKVKMLAEHPFFGILLQHARFAVSKTVRTACTNGEFILFGSDFCSRLNDDALYFVTFHEIMHIVLDHCFRGVEYNNYYFNVACDIVINSQILYEMNKDDTDFGSLGKPMHLTPDGKEGRDYTAEEVYNMICDFAEQKGEKAVTDLYGSPDQQSDANGQDNGQEDREREDGGAEREDQEEGEAQGGQEEEGELFKDDHSMWGEGENSTMLRQQWKYRVQASADVVDKIQNGWGNSEKMARRLLEKIKNPPLDWRTILHNFIQEEINDYSFSPPDRRYQDSPFMLPDFNEKDENPKNLWIVVDASGSISNRDLGLAYNEIAGAIEQFGGRLEGKLSYFDVEVTDPIPFSSISDLDKIPIRGGGGTSFTKVFEYLKRNVDLDPTCIIFITDGYSEYPDESAALSIPVLWLLNNNIVTPPWGEVARIKRMS